MIHEKTLTYSNSHAADLALEGFVAVIVMLDFQEIENCVYLIIFL